LHIPRQQLPDKEGFWYGLFIGQPATFRTLPDNGYFIKNDTVFARHYIDEDLEDTLAFSKAALHIPQNADAAAWLEKNSLETRRFYLGTDRYGRDILSRLLVGSRVSIAVGVVSV